MSLKSTISDVYNMLCGKILETNIALVLLAPTLHLLMTVQCDAIIERPCN